METKTYDLQYYINRFEQTQEEDWCINEFHKVVNGRDVYCAQGFLIGKGDELNTFMSKLRNTPYNSQLALQERMQNDYPELVGLWRVTSKGGVPIADVNNGTTVCYTQSTPRKRVLAYLRDLKMIAMKLPNDLKGGGILLNYN